MFCQKEIGEFMEITMSVKFRCAICKNKIVFSSTPQDDYEGIHAVFGFAQSIKISYLLLSLIVITIYTNHILKNYALPSNYCYLNFPIKEAYI